VVHCSAPWWGQLLGKRNSSVMPEPCVSSALRNLMPLCFSDTTRKVTNYRGIGLVYVCRKQKEFARDVEMPVSVQQELGIEIEVSLAL
jgi:hypothetical protein